jgi:hypothetical protein
MKADSAFGFDTGFTCKGISLKERQAIHPLENGVQRYEEIF